MNEKGTNDAAAFIRSIAEKRHRNLVWAEDAVRESVIVFIGDDLPHEKIKKSFEQL